MKFHKNPPKPRASNLFQIEKIHQPKTHLLRFLEILLILVVVIGTLLGFLAYKKISLTKVFTNFSQTIVPKEATKEVVKPTSFEEKIKGLLQANSIKLVRTSKTAEGDLLVVLQAKTTVIFAAKDDPEKQVTTLQTVLAKAKIEGKQVKKIDFRFENLVVEY